MDLSHDILITASTQLEISAYSTPFAFMLSYTSGDWIVVRIHLCEQSEVHYPYEAGDLRGCNVINSDALMVAVSSNSPHQTSQPKLGGRVLPATLHQRKQLPPLRRVMITYQIIKNTRDAADEDEATISLLVLRAPSEIMCCQFEGVNGTIQIYVKNVHAWFGRSRERV
jgi:hypothetical protein